MRQQLPSNIDKNTHSTFNRALEQSHALVSLLKINVLEIETPIKINS